MRHPRDKGLTAASILTAGLASICCIGPILATLGLGALGASGVFESLRPYLLGATALLLGAAFYLGYRKNECASGACPPAARTRQILIPWIAVALVVPLAGFPFYARLLTDDSRTPTVAKGDESAVVVFDITGMTCEGCASGMQATLRRVQGVSSVEVDFEGETAWISYSPRIVSTEQLAARIEKLGFRGTIRGPNEGT